MCAEAHHTFITIQSERHTFELRQVSAKQLNNQTGVKLVNAFKWAVSEQERPNKSLSFDSTLQTASVCGFFSNLSRVQLTDALLTPHRYPVARPTSRPSWSLTTMRSPLAKPLLARVFCGTVLLLWNRWRKTPSACTVTGPLSCRFPTQLPFFSLKTRGESILSLSAVMYYNRTF